jgi:hypothetical protein
MENKQLFSTQDGQMNLPNATTTLVLGILSLVFCIFYGIIGLVLGIIALILANKDRRLYNIDPSAYTKNSFSNSNAGRICAIIGIVLSSIYLLFIIGVIVLIGTNADFLEALKNIK